LATAASGGLDRYNTDTSPNYQAALVDIASGGTITMSHGRGSIIVWRSQLLVYGNDVNGVIGLYTVVLPKNSVDGEISVRLLVQPIIAGASYPPSSYGIVAENGSDILYIGSGSGNILR